MIIYVSDHGYLFGEHRLWGKSVPYTESIQAPLFIRWPGHVTAGSQDLRLVQNVDIAPTIVQAAGAHATASHPWDGRSLLRTTWSRPYAYGESFLVQDDNPDHWQPAWRSIRSLTYQYVEWRAAGHVIAREYYDLVSDPFQMQNLLGDGDPSNNPPLAALHAALLAEARCTGHAQCR